MLLRQKIRREQTREGDFPRETALLIVTLLEVELLFQLYDLMTMSVKFQLMLCPCAADIMKVTYNHVNSMRKLVRSPAVLDLLDKAFITFNEVSVSVWQADGSLILCLSLS